MVDLNCPPSTIPSSAASPFEFDPDPGHDTAHRHSGLCASADLHEGAPVVEDDDEPMEMPTSILGIEVDPAASLIPGPTRKNYQNIKADIAIHGLLDPAKRVRGKWADGRCRLMACQDLGITPAIIDLPDDTDTLALVMSSNAHRRHLTRSQLAIVVVAAREWVELGYNQHSGGCEPGASPSTSQGMADMAGVSKRLIQQAKIVHKAGLDQEVLAGRLSLKDAVALAKQDDRPRGDASKDAVSSDSTANVAGLSRPENRAPLITLKDPELVLAIQGGSKRASGTRKHASHEKQAVASVHQAPIDDYDSEIQRLRVGLQERDNKIQKLKDDLGQEQERTRSLQAKCDELQMKITKLETKAYLPVREITSHEPPGYMDVSGESSGTRCSLENQVMSQEVSCD